MSPVVDSRIRWKKGERLQHLFEARCDELEARCGTGHPAVIEGDTVYSFRDIDERANRLARHLLGEGIAPGDRVAVLLQRSKEVYVALLAILKVNAAYVPLDAAFPNERIGFILEDAGVKAILTSATFGDRLAELSQPKICIDADSDRVAAQPGARLGEAERGAPTDELAYIIYTSGTTGKPKGVAIEHASICNFVRVAAETYGIEATDRVFQGMTIAFDFSVEELWVPLLAGAALVPAPIGNNLVGEELAAFLEQHRISVLCCVPTLLATIERDLPDLRVLLVSGEACPHNLVSRWSKPGRRILNAYGPTEATVTATLTELVPDKPVTIGVALPTYTVVILDVEEDRLLEPGETGEIGIGGIGLARGYVNRDDLTAEKFIPDFARLPSNPSRRIYRTGDLGRFNAEGEIEYLGRKDTQVKVRGYRIELTEIESELLRLPGIAQAVVDTYEPEPGVVELVGYYSLKKGAEHIEPAQIAHALRELLPAYMVPAYYECLPVVPMTSSNKADRKALPAPQSPRCAVGSGEYVPPETETQERLAAILCELLKVPRVSLRDNFFSDLGAHSLLMARFCAEIRKDETLADISMREVYTNPTLNALGAVIDAARAAPSSGTDATPSAGQHVPSRLQHFACGTLQVATEVLIGLVALWAVVAGAHWAYDDGDSNAGLYLRTVALLIGLTLAWAAVPVVAKWLLIGRWKAETIPLWSLRYYRFWLVKSLIELSPPMLFPGSPAHNLYLRLLGGRIGRDATIRSNTPVCTDLFFVGERAIVRERTLMPGYYAEGNLIHIGGIHIGSDAFVGMGSVIEPGTEIGDGGQLGHSSCLARGQAIPNGKCFHGTPAVETTASYRTLKSRGTRGFRRFAYGVLTAALLLLVVAPAAALALFQAMPYVHKHSDALHADLTNPLAVAVHVAPTVLMLWGLLFVAWHVLGLIWIATVPWLLNMVVKPGREYPLFGAHYFVQNLISVFSNSGSFNVLFGDSSYVVHYLRLVGWQLDKVDQTGANFGMDQMHDNPFLCEIGTGTMASDDLMLANLEMSATSFRLKRVKIGANNYLGNGILYPAAARTGDNVLLGNKVLVPVDGPVREDVGLLGSPSFEIPRAVSRDLEAGALDKARRRRLLARKNGANLRTMAAYLLANFMFMFATLLSFYVSLIYYWQHSAAALAAFSVFMLMFSVAYWVLVERESLGFGRLCTGIFGMYDRAFLRHERHWKFCAHPLAQAFAGTPLKPLIYRLLGVKMGRMVFDDGADIFDKTLVEIGNYANLNVGAIVQGHSLEEGVFKTGRVRIGNGASIACGAFVHYDVELGDDAVLCANAFLMKGEVVEPGSLWRGNPARPVPRSASRALAQHRLDRIETAAASTQAAKPTANGHDCANGEDAHHSTGEELPVRGSNGKRTAGQAGCDDLRGGSKSRPGGTDTHLVS